MANHREMVKPKARGMIAGGRHYRWATIAALLMLVIGLAVPAWAARTVGTRLNLFGGDVPAAGEPFYVVHGFGNLDLTDGFEYAPWDFVLFVDGVAIRDSGVTVELREDGVQVFGRVYNFPGGMTGQHTFEGHWYQACRADDSACDPGSPPGAMYESVLERTVDFGE